MSTKRHLFRTGAGSWRCADDQGISAGPSVVLGDVELLDFDTALDLSQRYLENADLARDVSDEVAEERWATWAEELQIWAARSQSARGSIVIRHHAVHDDSIPAFSELCRR